MTDVTMDSASGRFSGPLWRSAFRPFYLLGVLYGLGVMGVWLLTNAGLIDVLPGGYRLSLWHGHEMTFGFSGAIVLGFVLTALPGWAGTKEITGGRLALLVVLWLGGRVAVYGGDVMPAYLVMALDCSLFLAAMIMVLPSLLVNKNKHYLGLLPIFFMLFIGNVIFHLAVMDGDMARASWAIQIGIMGIVVKFILAGGFLTTVFTGNALKQKTGEGLVLSPLLEYVSAATIGFFIYGALGGYSEGYTSGKLTASFAFLAAAVQVVRFWRWRSFHILDAPLVVVMHLAYLWFIGALILYGAASFTAKIGPHVWLHAFTVGALSLMMLSLLTRVTLRHTGRKLIPAKAMILSFAVLFFCAFLRIFVSLGFLDDGWFPAIAALWALPFLIYMALYGAYLIRPSLPKRKGPKVIASELVPPIKNNR